MDPKQPEIEWQSLQWPDGATYEGLTRNGHLHRSGIFQHANADRYEGEFVDGLPEGYGVYVWQNGTVYRGEWRAGLIHGCGVQLRRGQQQGQFDVREGKFFADGFCGPIMECSAEASQTAALEADVAARMANSAFSTPEGRQQRMHHARSVRNGGAGGTGLSSNPAPGAFGSSGNGLGAGLNAQGLGAAGVMGGEVRGSRELKQDGEGGGFKWPFPKISWPWAPKTRTEQEQKQQQQQQQQQQQRQQDWGELPPSRPLFPQTQTQTQPYQQQQGSNIVTGHQPQLQPHLQQQPSQQQQQDSNSVTVSLFSKPGRHLSRNQQLQQQQQQQQEQLARLRTAEAQDGEVGHRTRGLTLQEQQLMGGIVGQLMKAEAEVMRANNR